MSNQSQAAAAAVAAAVAIARHVQGYAAAGRLGARNQNSTSSSECADQPEHLYVQLTTFWYAFLALITTVGLLVSLVSNMIIIYLFSRTPKLRQNPSNIIAVNLSLSDLLYCTQWPSVIYCSITQSTWLLEIDLFCQTFGFITVSTALASILTVLAMSIERAIVIIYSISAKSRYTNRIAWLIVVLIWIVSVCSCLPPLFGKFNRYTLDPSKTSCTLDYLSSEPKHKLYIFALYVAYWIIPAVLITICYSLIIATFKRSTKSLNTVEASQQERRVARLAAESVAHLQRQQPGRSVDQAQPTSSSNLAAETSRSCAARPVESTCSTSTSFSSPTTTRLRLRDSIRLHNFMGIRARANGAVTATAAASVGGVDTVGRSAPDEKSGAPLAPVWPRQAGHAPKQTVEGAASASDDARKLNSKLGDTSEQQRQPAAQLATSTPSSATAAAQLCASPSSSKLDLDRVNLAACQPSGSGGASATNAIALRVDNTIKVAQAALEASRETARRRRSTQGLVACMVAGVAPPQQRARCNVEQIKTDMGQASARQLGELLQLDQCRQATLGARNSDNSIAPNASKVCMNSSCSVQLANVQQSAPADADRHSRPDGKQARRKLAYAIKSKTLDEIRCSPAQIDRAQHLTAPTSASGSDQRTAGRPRCRSTTTSSNNSSCRASRSAARAWARFVPRLGLGTGGGGGGGGWSQNSVDQATNAAAGWFSGLASSAAGVPFGRPAPPPLLASNSSANLRQARASTQFRLAKMSFYLIMLWFVSWSPIATLAMLNSVLKCHRASATAVFVACTMTKLGPALDVFIYGISHPVIKSKFKQIIMWLFMMRRAGLHRVGPQATSSRISNTKFPSTSASGLRSGGLNRASIRSANDRYTAASEQRRGRQLTHSRTSLDSSRYN